MKIKQLLMLMLMVGIVFSLSAQDASFYKKYADKGDKEAMYNLAFCYINGNGGVQQDYNQATFWFTKAAKKNYAPAQVSLAYCYLYGTGVMKDYKQAWDLAQKAIKQQNAAAYYLIAQMCKDGMYVKQNNAGYLQNLKTAARLGDDDAQVELGEFYLSGNETPYVAQNIREGLTLFEKSAQQNNGEALLKLGCYYRDGLDGYITKDPQKGFQYIQAAAQTGLPRAWFEYGYVNLYGWGCEPNVTEAARYISAAAEEDVPNAYKLMGDLYLYGYGVEQDDKTAAQWYQKAVDAGYGNAYSQLAWLCLTGRGVSEDASKGYSLYKAAADAGYPEGNAGLGMCYENGLGVTQNVSQAVKYFQLAADAGNNYSQFRLYGILRDGNGVSKDVSKALQYLRDAANNEYADAMYSLGYEYYVGEIMHQENSQAVKWMTKAADAGNAFAAAMIGNAYYSGTEPFTKDFNLAFKYLSQAAQYLQATDEKDELAGQLCRNLAACYRFGRGTEVNNSLASFYTELAAQFGNDESVDAVNLIRRNNEK